MWLEDPRHHTSGDTRSVVDSHDRHLSLFFTHRDLDASRRGESRVLEDIQQHIAHLVLPSHRPARPIRTTKLPFDRAIAHLLETDHVLHDGCDIYCLSRRKIGWSASVPAERSRDFVEAVD